MNNSEYIDLSSITIEDHPFPHFYSLSALKNDVAIDLYDWFENTNKWNLTQMEFYEQYEINLLNSELPKNLRWIIDSNTISNIVRKFKSAFNIHSLNLVGVTAHKLVNGQRIGIHNDFINGDETHRLVFHINPYWSEENGGFLLLFGSSDAADICKIVNPFNNTAFGFEISSHSHHAVSKIYDFTRYSIVYTFLKA